jgi:hypothetical protein
MAQGTYICVFAGFEKALMAQFYRPHTSFLPKPDNFSQQTFFCLPTISKNPASVQKWQRHQTIAKDCVL